MMFTLLLLLLSYIALMRYIVFLTFVITQSHIFEMSTNWNNKSWDVTHDHMQVSGCTVG